MSMTTDDLLLALAFVGIGAYLLGMLIGFVCGYAARNNRAAGERDD